MSLSKKLCQHCQKVYKQHYKALREKPENKAKALKSSLKWQKENREKYNAYQRKYAREHYRRKEKND